MVSYGVKGPRLKSDRQLVERICRQDSQAFDELMRRHEPLVRRHLLRIVRDPAAADDLAQDVFLRLWQKAGQWRGKGAFRAWLMRIATNLALNHLRALRRRPHRPLQPAPGPGDEDQENTLPAWMVDPSAVEPDEAMEQAERRDLFRRMIEDLPDEKRQVLQMVHEEDMDLADVARALGVPLGTVKSRLHYTIKRLGSQWRQVQDQWENP